MSTLAVFLLLAGGTAFAATQLAKKSVGTKQLKANAVTAAKIKKNAVTGAKIKAGAVDGTKILDGSVTGTDINAASTSFSQVVARIRNTASAPFKAATAYPVGNYTQNAGETNQWIAGLDVNFPAECIQPRTATAYLLVNAANPAMPTIDDVVGLGAVRDLGSGAVTRRIRFGAFIEALKPMAKPAPSTPTPYSFTLYLGPPKCEGGGDGVTVAGAALDVIGTK
jgi:hypothetical protein